jgi:hypothetical protein
MSRFSVHLTALSLVFVAGIGVAQALQIGPRITCCSSHGPNIGGWKPGERPIPDKPLDGAKMAVEGAKIAVTKALSDTQTALGKFGTAAWAAFKRPFVETWKFIRDPLAGFRRRVQEAYARIIADATALAYQVVKWLSIGFGAALAFSIGLAIGLAGLLFRHRSFPKLSERSKDRLNNNGAPLGSI